MDVESLAKELILKNMTPEQQMAVLDSVKASVAQAREVQKRKIGENVDIVVQALKTIEADIRSRFDDVGNAIEKRVSSIKDGRDGSNGKDGRDGKDGKNGRDGAKGEKGESGQAGIDGVDGVDGVSVTNAHIDFDGSLIITLSTGVELNVGEVVAPDLAESIKVITNGGGTSQSVLDTLASLQTQINNLGNGLVYKGTWNASTNTPTLTSSSGTSGNYYVVSVSGSTNLNGVTDWVASDWAIYNGSVWQKIDQTNLVTSVAGKTGAVVLNNTDVSGFANIAAAGGTTVLTVSSAPNYVVTGSGGQTIQLPDATTLQNGAIFSFNNNQSSGTIIVKNNSSTTVSTIQSGGYVSLVLLSNSLAAGSWDVHNYAPSNVSWSTNTFDYAGSITSATWNGNAVAYNRGGTGQSSAFVAGGIVYGSTTSALAVTAIGTTGQVLTSAGAGTPTWTTPTTGTVTSVTGTSPISSTGGNTPAISLAASYGDTQNPYASKTANFVLAAPNGSAGAPTFRGIVAADIPTLNQNTTGSAATLTTARAIYGNNFDGSAALTQVIASTYGGTGNGFTKFSGPATAEKTYTLPNASATILTDNALVTSAQGGTGNGFTKFTGATTSEKTYTLPNSSSTLLYDGGALGTPASGTVTNLTGTASININGTVGATTANTGSFTSLAYSTTLTGGTGIVNLGSGQFYKDASGNVGIGTSSVTGKFQVKGATNQNLYITGSTSIANSVVIGGINDAASANIPLEFRYGTTAAFINSGTEAMRIDSSGNLLVGGTTVRDNARITCETAGQNGLAVYVVPNTNAVDFALFRANAGTLCGNISRVGTTAAVVYSTTSDYRLKNVIGVVTGHGERIDALKPIHYEWKDGGASTSGFLAHEFQEIYANSVTGTKDNVDKDGKPVYQGMQASSAEVIADLVAEIQSLRKRLTALEQA